MKLLLDTHTFLWFITGDLNLSARARSLIEDVVNEKFFSVASLWEIAIKLSLGKLTVTAPLDLLMPQQLRLNGIELLNIKIAHTAVVAALPFHHRDPFDRLLIAQAMIEEMAVIGADTAFDAYPVKRLW